VDTSKPNQEAKMGEKKLETMPTPRQQRALDLTADQPAARLRIHSLADLAMPGESLTDAEFDELMAVIDDARRKSIPQPPKL